MKSYILIFAVLILMGFLLGSFRYTEQTYNKKVHETEVTMVRYGNMWSSCWYVSLEVETSSTEPSHGHGHPLMQVTCGK